MQRKSSRGVSPAAASGHPGKLRMQAPGAGRVNGVQGAEITSTPGLGHTKEGLSEEDERANRRRTFPQTAGPGEIDQGHHSAGGAQSKDRAEFSGATGLGDPIKKAVRRGNELVRHSPASQAAAPREVDEG